MKYIYTAILILLSTTSQAQQDILPISQDGLWIMGSGSFPIGQWVLDTPWRIAISDTVNVNDTLYLQFSNLGICSDNTFSNDAFLLREDSGKYYHKNNITDPEQLWFDFTLDVGDTVGLKWGSDSLELSVLALDSVILQDGTQRRMWTLQYTDILWTEQWIEGIGSADWGWMLFGSGGAFDLNLWLRCYYENDEWVGSFEYSSLEPGCCSIVNVPEIDLNNLRVYPNPANNHLTIESPSSISMIEITDMMGRIVFVSRPLASLFTLDMDVIPQGCYCITAVFGNDDVVKTKFLKN
jgi:Secretion system C-terminal sorting domain